VDKESVADAASELDATYSPVVDFDVTSASDSASAAAADATPTLSSPNTSTESEPIEAGRSAAERQRELEAEMEAEMERARAEEKKRKEEILRRARDVHKEEMSKATRRASNAGALKPVLPTQAKMATFDDFSVTPTRDDASSEETTPVSERLF
jgi:flagellar biosynthesis/type III secretory pathway protein FliH